MWNPPPRRFDPAQPELMDRPQPVSEALDKDLANLRSLNRHFGSYRIIHWFFRNRLRPGQKLTVLDLATGSGDIPRLLASECRRRGVEIGIEALDFQGATVEIARRLSADFPEIQFHEADLLAFEPECDFDYVLCSLALHHFSESDAVEILRRAAGWARRGVLIADLERSRLASGAIRFITATVYRDEMTRVDARLSAERAFSFRELHELATQAGWESFGHRRFAVARQVIWMRRAK